MEGPMRRRLIRIALILLFFPPLLAAVAGWLSGPAFLHPIRRELTPDLIREADASFAFTGSTREDFDVRAPDGVLLRGWKVRPKNPNGSWVLVFHGVADNRVGVIGQSEFLLRAGYGVVMMDARAHGASGGPIATYGWLERNDTRAIIDALLSDSSVNRVQPSRVGPSSSFTSSISSTSLTSSFHLFALGESMGAGIVLQSAAADPRIEAVVAEASFANMREASYDYAGLRKYPWLGKTLLAPFSWTLLYRGEKLAGFPVAEVSRQKAVAARAFPVLLICDEKDVALPCRHSEMIYAAARGPKQLWVVPGAFHTAAYAPSSRRTPVCPSSKQLARGRRFADTGINFLFQLSAGEKLQGQIQPCLVCPNSNFTLPISISLFNARDAAALPTPGSAAARFPADARPARQSFRASALRRAGVCRHFSGEPRPAAVLRFPESRSAGCSARGGAPLQNLLPIPRTDRARCPPPSGPGAGGSGSGQAPTAGILHRAPRNPLRPHRSAPRAPRASPQSQSPPPAHRPQARSPPRRAAARSLAVHRLPARSRPLPERSPSAHLPQGFAARRQHYSRTPRAIPRHSFRIPSAPPRTALHRHSLPIWFVRGYPWPHPFLAAFFGASSAAGV